MRAHVSRHVRQVTGAINRLRVSDAKSNSAVWAEGPPRTLLTMTGPRTYSTPLRSFSLLTMVGPRYYFEGVLTFRYYDTTVLVVDLYNKRLTDFGYHEYSISTRKNVRDWLDAVKDRFHLSHKIPHDWYRWTDCWRPPRETGRDKKRPEREVDVLLERFRYHAPWVELDMRPGGTCWWFYWNKYDEKVADQLWDAKRFLADNQNHRYYDYHWSDDPDCPGPVTPLRWVRHFKDDNAMRRWRQREKRNGRPCPPI